MGLEATSQYLYSISGTQALKYVKNYSGGTSQYFYFISGTQALEYVKNYAEATSQWEGFPIQVDVPRSDILLGKLC